VVETETTQPLFGILILITSIPLIISFLFIGPKIAYVFEFVEDVKFSVVVIDSTKNTELNNITFNTLSQEA